MTEQVNRRVAVIGGGVSGLTAAHELADQGFSVTVFERRQRLGGKAASWQAESPLPPLPGEHGFRFFPGFYYHVVDTMSRITGTDGRSVKCHLVELDTAILADGRGNLMINPLPTSKPRPLLWERLKASWAFRSAMPGPWESLCFLATLARLATTCEKRWTHRLESLGWMDHVINPRSTRLRSDKFKQLFAVGLTRSFVATRAEDMNARTGGQILMQLLYDSFLGPPVRSAPDRALDGPTSKVWIEPWTKYLKDERHVTFRCGCTVAGLEVADNEVIGIRLQSQDSGVGGTAEREVAPAAADPVADRRAVVNRPHPLDLEPGDRLDEDFDWYILAVPCEVLKQLLVNTPALLKPSPPDRSVRKRRHWRRPLRALASLGQGEDGQPTADCEPELGKVFNLKTRWMNGLVLGLTEEPDPPLPRGHVLCLNSEWALTLLDQTKVWSDEHLAEVRKHWKALLSVDISDWNTPGTTGVPAKWTQPPLSDPPAASGAMPPRRDELVEEVWRQLQAHLPALNDQDAPTDAVLDFDIQYTTEPPIIDGQVRIARHRTNDEPLLINTGASWANRPTASTDIPNLFIAGDFARTHTNFASMEAANEAARNAVNALFKAAGHPHTCCVKPLEDPNVWWFAGPQQVARKIDELLFRWRVPLRPPFRLPLAAWIVLGVVAQARGTWREPPKRRRLAGRGPYQGNDT